MHFLYYTLTLISSWIYLIYIFYFYFSCKKKLTRNPSKKTRQTFTKNTRKNNFAELSSIAVLRYGRKWKPSRSANKKIHTYTDNRNAEKKLKSSGQISTKQSKKNNIIYKIVQQQTTVMMMMTTTATTMAKTTTKTTDERQQRWRLRTTTTTTTLSTNGEKV